MAMFNRYVSHYQGVYILDPEKCLLPSSPRLCLAFAASRAGIPQREGALAIIAQGPQLTEGAVGWEELDAVPG